MLIRHVSSCLFLLAFLGFASWGALKTGNDKQLSSTDPSAGDWLLYGRTSDDQRFSPLSQINEQTVANLGMVWSREMGTTRGLEATPLVQHGVLYTTGSWSVVYALDAKTGKQLWTYDPQVKRERAKFFCCDAVNRGVALYGDRLFVGTLDGTLVALDKRTGAPVWTANTADITKAYSITGAPRIAGDRVIIGNAGAENGVRGYVSAYDAETGKLAWRFYTVPGNPADGFESKAMEDAAKTWHGEWWTAGGGGTVWDAIAYDPALDLLYFGTGNASAWYRTLRGGGDNLYTASIVAVHARNGELAWHFQTTPGDNWDYDATQPLLQADLNIAGQPRKVIMQPNKNGFFYVLDRATGEFLSGTAYVSGISWATSLDPKTGRPIEAPGVAGSEAAMISPDPGGAHNWNPTAFSPATRLVYLSAKNSTQMVHVPDPKWKYDPNSHNEGLDSHEVPLHARLDDMPPSTGELLAWDPVARKAVWRAPTPVLDGGGVLATAGNLVFQGRSDGILAAYRATDGKQLWSFDAGTGIMAPPVTYTVDGVQHLCLMVGMGGVPGLYHFPGQGPIKIGHGRIVTFALGGNAVLHPPAFGHQDPPVPVLALKASPQQVQEGARLFSTYCMQCHGAGAVAGALPDLRYSSKETLLDMENIVLRGTRASVGMPSFGTVLNAKQIGDLRAYILSRGAESAKAAEKPRTP
jgi:quinohemoprotein ethanol dehydrogenase